MATNIQHDSIMATNIQDNCIMATTQNTEKLNVAMGKEITCIGSEVIKAVIESVNKKSQDCIQSGRQLKNVIIEI